MSVKKKVFISWSKVYSGKIAYVLKGYLENIFGNKIDFFISKEIRDGSLWHAELSQALGESEMGIFVLTSENINAPWVLFEAGAIYNIKKPICMLLFNRNDEHACGGQIESPFRHITYSSFLKNDDEKFFLNVLSNVNHYCGIGFSDNVLQYVVDANLEKFTKEINGLVEELKQTYPDYNNMKTIDQLKVSTSVKDILGDIPGKKDILIEDLPSCFKKAVEKLPEKYRKKMNEKVDDKNETFDVFLINNTRISTFIAITDDKYERIVLFDRKKGKKFTSIDNQRFDVFGSVPFQNHKLLTKLSSAKDILKSKIEEAKEIPGFAFENNEDIDLFRETVIMFGYVVSVSDKDIEKIPEFKSDSQDIPDQVFVIKISSYQYNTYLINNLTAKAELALRFLIENKENKKCGTE